MNKPILSYDTPMGHGDGTWKHAGGYSIWTTTAGATEPSLDLWELRAGQADKLPPVPYVLHNIGAGTPHRLAHVFGFWRISEGDAIFLKATEGSNIHHTLAVTTGDPNYRRDRIAWFCRACNLILHEVTFATRRFGLDALWSWALAEARAFNSSVGVRTCASCGTLHPAAYGFFAGTDMPEEKSARETW